MRPDVIVLTHGGPFADPASAGYSIANSDAVGYAAGSSGERVPTEAAIVAIDGPAGSGKSTTARGVGEILGLPVLDTGARGSSVTFAQRNQGDVLISWENEAHLLEKEFGHKVGIVYPSLSILAEPPVAVVDKGDFAAGTSSKSSASRTRPRHAPRTSASPAIARWKACECRFGMPGSSGPARRSTCQAWTSGVTAEMSPDASTSILTFFADDAPKRNSLTQLEVFLRFQPVKGRT